MASGHELPGSFREALAIARRLLSASHELVRRDLVDAEAEILVMEAYRKVAGRALSRSEFYLRTADRYPEAAAAILLTWAGARAEGRLLQHLTGVQVFLNHEYEVGPDALVPRPETEVLVTVATEELGGGRSTPVRGLEIGLGSGAIAIELLSRFPGLRIRASELSEGAVALAVRNAEKILGSGWATRLEIVRPGTALEVFEPFAQGLQRGPADFLISNPPYLVRD
ncbi:MAG: hypothetical protein NDJ90_11430, partial [Oligoflexia bacterium]|nr:hypothetical protein [Oligoflexia bacterium]